MAVIASSQELVEESRSRVEESKRCIVDSRRLIAASLRVAGGDDKVHGPEPITRRWVAWASRRSAGPAAARRLSRSP